MAGRFQRRSRGKRTRYVVHNTYMWFRICFTTYWSVTVVCFLVTVKCRFSYVFFSPLIILVLVMTEEQLMNCNIFLFFVKKWLTWRQIFIHFVVIYRTFLSTGLLSASRRRPERWGGGAVCARSWRVHNCVCAGVWDVLLLPATVHWLYGCGGRLHAPVCQVPLPPCRG